MRLRLLLAVLLLVLAAPAAAARLRPRTAYCSPTGDYCAGTYRARGVRHISFRTFSLRGRMRLCVTPPRGPGGCHSFPLRPRGGGIYEVDVRWRRHFAFRGRGRYVIAFSQSSWAFPKLSFVY